MRMKSPSPRNQQPQFITDHNHVDVKIANYAGLYSLHELLFIYVYIEKV